MKIKLPNILSLRSVEPFLSSVNNNLAQNEDLHLDLSVVHRTYPGGLLPVVSILRSHIRGGGRVLIDAFPETEQCNYLCGMNFYVGLEQCNHQHAAPHHDVDRLVGIADIGSPNLSESERVKLARLVKQNVRLSGNTGKSFLTAFGEIIQNTKHAYNAVVDPQSAKWPPALIQAQYYRDEELIYLGVADCGVGLKRSIGAKDPYLYSTDKAAIKAALVLGMRGGAGPSAVEGRGLGLAAIKRFISRNGGSFSIRSGTCLAILAPRQRFYDVPMWKGAVVTLEIKTSRNVDMGAIIGKLEQALQ
jgi:hypothetical protein